MTPNESPFKSRKFIAFLVADIGWKALMMTLMLTGSNMFDQAVLIAMILTNGFVEVGFILGQTFIDRYVKIAQIAVGDGSKVEVPVPKGLVITPKEPNA